MKEKILYIMHVDWAWIKQRPHFIAEGLSEFFDVTVVHFRSKNYIFKGTDPNNKELKIIPAFRLPLYQNRFVYILNKIYMKFFFKSLIKKFDPDFIWITFPQMYDYIPSDINCKIIYDCMDLATGFDFSEEFKSIILDLEEKLVNDASLVLASSNYLFKRLKNRYQCEKKLLKIRNAFGGEIIDNNTEKDPEKPYKIGYVGTISKWIDFETIKKTLEEIEDIEYYFIGPCELKKQVNEDRIKFYGAIDYRNLYDYVKNYDCLIVPFKVDEKIKSADPGKIYNYINYNKPIVSVYYEELEYFSQFIYFYSNSTEFVELLNHMRENGFKKRYSDSERTRFLENNSWNERIIKVKNFLENINRD